MDAMRDFLEELQRRKDRRDADEICCDCDGIGGIERKVCMSCLGQGVLLTREEYDALLAIGRADDEAILSQEVFEDYEN